MLAAMYTHSASKCGHEIVAPMGIEARIAAASSARARLQVVACDGLCLAGDRVLNAVGQRCNNGFAIPLLDMLCKMRGVKASANQVHDAILCTYKVVLAIFQI